MAAVAVAPLPSQGGVGGLPEGTTPEMIPAKDEINIPMLYDKTLAAMGDILAHCALC